MAVTDDIFTTFNFEVQLIIRNSTSLGRPAHCAMRPLPSVMG